MIRPSTSKNKRPKSTKTSFGEVKEVWIDPLWWVDQSTLWNFFIRVIWIDQLWWVIHFGPRQNRREWIDPEQEWIDPPWFKTLTGGCGSIQNKSGSIQKLCRRNFDSKTREIQWLPNQTQPRPTINIKGYKRALQQLIVIGHQPQTHINL